MVTPPDRGVLFFLLPAHAAGYGELLGDIPGGLAENSQIFGILLAIADTILARRGEGCRPKYRAQQNRG